jgi:VanZ family protein
MTARNIWKAAFLVWLVVLFLSSTSEVGEFASDWYDDYLDDSLQQFGLDSDVAQKLLHVVLFVVLGWLVAELKLPPSAPWVRSLVWCFPIGAVTELIQIVMDGRGPSFLDALINGVAGTLSCRLALWLASRRQAES